jgi:hypothetical protein
MTQISSALSASSNFRISDFDFSGPKRTLSGLSGFMVLSFFWVKNNKTPLPYME